MIRLACPNCRSKLNAKDELAGQTRKCPKCGHEVSIPQVGATAELDPDEWDGLDDVAPDQHVVVADDAMPPVKPPERLSRSSRYCICDRTKVLALWEPDGSGWMLKTNVGLVSAKRNPDQLPAQGDFMLVELLMATTDEGLRLRGIRTHELAKRWALTALEQDDFKILTRIIGPGRLNRDQKAAVQQFLREHFMRDVWQDASEVIDYLTNFDYHSQGVE